MNRQYAPLTPEDRPAPGWPSTQQLLVAGGDGRVALLPGGAVNRYGCQPFPDPGVVGLGSSTASVISSEGFGAAALLRRRLVVAARGEPCEVTYARELHRIRQELRVLLRISGIPGVEIVFGASGTDLHLIATHVVPGESAAAPLVVNVEAAETGSSVPAAVAGRHFSDRAALGSRVNEGQPINGVPMNELYEVPLRRDDGTPRSAAEVDAAVDARVSAAAARGQRVLVIVVDVSKTGLIAPTPALASDLLRRFPGAVEVLVDACQFRLAPATLRAYLERGFIVAITGSKFIGGPCFSGALLIPASTASRLQRTVLPRALAAHSARADWPAEWQRATRRLDGVANFGLLLRWEAALAELRSFRALAEPEVARFLADFARAVGERLASDPAFAPLPVPPLDRAGAEATMRWDAIQTVFPFLLRRSAAALSRDQTLQVYRLMQIEPFRPGDRGAEGEAGNQGPALRFHLGQPASCGHRSGVPVSALRLCSGARLCVEALAGGGGNSRAVISLALAALDRAAMLIHSVH